jgi:Bacterial regulatory proteins, lacI family
MYRLTIDQELLSYEAKLSRFKFASKKYPFSKHSYLAFHVDWTQIQTHRFPAVRSRRLRSSPGPSEMSTENYDLNTKKPTSMRDVARSAGVSVATVSRALDGSPLVTEETALAVKQAVAELDFVPNISARTLIAQSCHSALEELRSGCRKQGRQVYIPVELVVRESTGRAPVTPRKRRLRTIGSAS